MATPKFLTGHERELAENDIIVSKADLHGKILYSNEVFCDISDFKVHELIGIPHSIIRHPDMPRGVFKFFWDYIKAGKEFFGYIINRSKNGDHYWVFAHVTPSFNEKNEVIGYHSNRRKPSRTAVKTIAGIYKTIRDEESKWPDKESVQKGYDKLIEILQSTGKEYDPFIHSLQ